ncbi:hypothetical protein MGYG_03977 [Nannizzia gypsea CBS 118893]|uniref:Uncharacterized protein n=1 Tax=Arthroderma gypseum (strain ATCC MYA-4604 / CBS 118893) TaxID=535722 RepID=E4UUK8_ARTGP|nr:hypothetical protein MGYG_03977 [Nannizzia gypsea CBS 118893]EFR00975.1 hypothetical protein MGYG_03977 [Nannizzia gypsea CBS 118893]
MVLLSSSTVGVALSSSIFGFFTLILFLSGYALQQQSVKHIQVALQRSPAANIKIEPIYPSELVWDDAKPPSEHVGNPDSKRRGHILGRRTKVSQEIDEYVLDGLAEEGEGIEEGIAKAKNAFLHILTKPVASDICSTILLFEKLASNSSQTSERVLLYPKAWDASSPTKSVSSALAILKKSSARLNAVVQGVDTSNIRPKALSETQMMKMASDQLVKYERVLFLRSPGHIVSIDKLEQMITSDIVKTMRVGTSRMIPPTWIPAHLSITQRQLPPALLVASEPSIGTSGKEPSKPHVLNSETMQQMNYVMESSESPGRYPGPAYVYFETGMVHRGGRVDMHYSEWKKQVQSVCEGVNLGL